MTTINRVARNTTLLFSSTILSYIFVFFATMYTARYLGAEGFGILSFALAFSGILTVFMDLGMSTLAVREVARKKSLGKKYIGNITIIKLILSVLTFGFMFVFVTVADYPQQVSNVVYIITFSTIITSYNTMFYSIFQAYEKIEYQSLGIIINSSLMLALVLILIYYGFNLIDFASAYIIVNLICFFYCVLICSWKFFVPKIEVDLSFWKPTIVAAFPLSLTLLFSAIGFRVDSVLLSVISGNVAVGYYTAPYKIIEALIFVPSVLNVVIYPVMSKFYISSKESLINSYKKAIKYLIILGLPLAVGIFLLADKIILLIYGIEFIPSITALQILIWEIPLIFLTYIFGTFLVSINKQNLSLKINFICMILNIVLNLVLIPNYSYLAASFVTVLTEIAAFIMCFYYLSKLICEVKIYRYLLKPAIASAVLGLFIYIAQLDLFFSVIIGTLLYFAVLISLKTFSEEDVILIKKMLQRV